LAIQVRNHNGRNQIPSAPIQREKKSRITQSNTRSVARILAQPFPSSDGHPLHPISPRNPHHKTIRNRFPTRSIEGKVNHHKNATHEATMKFERIALSLLAAALLVPAASSACAQDTTKPTVGQDLKKAGTDTKDATKKTGHAIAKGTTTAAKDTAKGTKTAAKDTEKGTKTAAKDTAKGTKTAAKATANGTKKVVHSAAHGTAKTADKVENKTSPK